MSMNRANEQAVYNAIEKLLSSSVGNTNLYSICAIVGAEKTVGRTYLVIVYNSTLTTNLYQLITVTMDGVHRATATLGGTAYLSMTTAIAALDTARLALSAPADKVLDWRA